MAQLSDIAQLGFESAKCFNFSLGLKCVLWYVLFIMEELTRLEAYCSADQLDVGSNPSGTCVLLSFIRH